MTMQDENKVCEDQSGEHKDFKQCLNYQHCQGFAEYVPRRIDLGKYQVKHKNLCFHCNHWEELVEKINDPEIYSIRIEGRHYQTHKNHLFRRPGKYNGFGGRQFVIKIHPLDTELNSDGTLITTHNLWTQGIIPEYFRDRLFDNASFVNEVTETLVYDGEQFITAFDVKPISPQ